MNPQVLKSHTEQLVNLMTDPQFKLIMPSFTSIQMVLILEDRMIETIGNKVFQNDLNKCMAFIAHAKLAKKEQENLQDSIKRPYDHKWVPFRVDNWPPMPIEFELNKIYQIPHLNLAFDVKYTNRPLLFHKETIRLVNALNAAIDHQPEDQESVTCRGMLVEGAPGIDKSYTTWAWLLGQIARRVDPSKKKPLQLNKHDSEPEIATASASALNISTAVNRSQVKSILWVHMNMETAICVRLTEDVILKASFQITITDQYDYVLSLLTSETDQIIVLDGLMSSVDLHQKLAWVLESNKSCFSVQVASLGFVRQVSIRELMYDMGIFIQHMKPLEE